MARAKPFADIPSGAALVAAVCGFGVLAWWRRRQRRELGLDATAAPSPGKSTAGPADDPIVGPAYPYLVAWTPEQRRALYDAQVALGLDISKGALPGVIQHE